jgi:hypothetical protein
MRAYIGIEEKECYVKGEFIYGEPYIIKVVDMKTMQDIRGYLDVAVLDRLASDWALAQEEDSVE